MQLLLVVPCFEEGVDDLGLHFLDIFHKSYWGTTPPYEGSDKYEPGTPCAVELAEAGIRFKKSDTDSIHDVDFENGVSEHAPLRALRQHGDMSPQPHGI